MGTSLDVGRFSVTRYIFDKLECGLHKTGPKPTQHSSHVVRDEHLHPVNNIGVIFKSGVYRIIGELSGNPPLLSLPPSSTTTRSSYRYVIIVIIRSFIMKIAMRQSI